MTCCYEWYFYTHLGVNIVKPAAISNPPSSISKQESILIEEDSEPVSELNLYEHLPEPPSPGRLEQESELELISLHNRMDVSIIAS